MKFTFIHYIFHDKDNYQHDTKLQQRWESFKYILGWVSKESLPLAKEKFIYFMKFKKLVSLKRFTIGAFIAATIYFGTYYGSKAVINYINDTFGLHIFENSVKYISRIDEYVPDTISIEKRKKDLSILLGLGIEDLDKKFTFITFYTADSTKTLKKFLERLGEIESRNDYKSRRVGSQYLGRWQMGDGARRTIGFGNISYEKFLNTPEIQDAAVILLLKYNYNYMKSHLKKYNNKIIRGYHLTTSGLLAMAHNVGADAVILFLNSGCTNVPRDGNGPSDRFLILGNYDLTTLEK